MAVYINESICIGCGRCQIICPGNLLYMKDAKAKMRDVSDCWSCCACIKTCPVQAIGLYLPVEAGGAGHLMDVTLDESSLLWTIRQKDRQVLKQWQIQRKESNYY